MNKSSKSSPLPTELDLRLGEPSDTDRILELVRLSLGVGPIPRERRYWEWKHHQNPFGASPMLIAEAEGELVGLRAFMRWQWRSGDQIVSAVRAVDTATHPQWQGRGIFSRLTRAMLQRMREEKVGFVFNTPNDQSRPGYLKMGWSSVGRLSPWIRPSRPLALLRAAVGKEVGTAIPDADLVVDAPTVADLLNDPDLAALLAATRQGDTRYTTPVSTEYLAWRYRDVPGFSYRALWDIKGDEGAVLIFRVKAQGPLSELRLCEILVGRGRGSLRTARRLVREAAGAAKCDYASGLAASRSEEHAVLAWSGFLPAARLGPILTALPLVVPPAAPDPLQRSSWRASTGDLELF